MIGEKLINLLVRIFRINKNQSEYNNNERNEKYEDQISH